MAAITLESDAIRITIPQSWNELSPEQCAKCALILRTRYNTNAEQQLRLLYVLLNLRWYHFRQLYHFWKLPAETKFNLLEGTEFLYGENTRTKNPFPKIGNLTGPEDKIEYITGAEFAAAEEHLEQLHKTGNLTELKYLAAALWRPSIPLSEREYKTRAKTMNLPTATLYAMLQFYEAARKPYITLLQEYFPTIGAERPKTIKGWQKVFYNLSPHVTAVDDVASQPLERIIGWLIDQKETAAAKPANPNEKVAVSFNE